MPKLLSDLLKSISTVKQVTGDTVISAPVVEADKDVLPGGLFIARAGLSFDGHTLIPRAIEKGAAAIVGEQAIDNLPVPYVQVVRSQDVIGPLAAAYHDFPSRKLHVTGVTGTDGKTTTTTLLHGILKQATQGHAGFISTVAADLGGETVETGLHVTTPGAPQVQALLARMVDNGLTHAVVEMTSHGLAQGRLNGVDIDMAVLTNLTHEHLDYHGTFENYRDAKALMFRMLNSSARKRGYPKVAIINGDDANADYFAAIPADKVIRYGMHSTSDFRAADVLHRPDSTQFVLRANGETLGVFFTLLAGDFNIMNALASITAARSLNIGRDAIQRGLFTVQAIKGRMERIDEGQDYTAIVDFAHTPNALKNALLAARSMTGHGGRVITVFGCAGLRDREKRRLMPEAAAQYADYAVLTAEDPRTESLDAILDVMAQACTGAGGVEGTTFERVPDRGMALLRACSLAQAGDVVIACGKGHEQSMAFGTVEYAWSDHDGLRSAIHGKPVCTLPTAKDSDLCK